jgi:hypothetical protein
MRARIARRAVTLAAGVVSASLALTITGPALAARGAAMPAWLSYGPVTVYPAAGGTWQYGFWDAKVRSYYWLGQNHRSTVILNGTTHRSICTSAGAKSVAEAWAIQWWGGDDTYYYSTSC